MPEYEPRPITVTVVGDGFYIAREETGEILYVPSPSEYEDLYEWTMCLGDTELEAALQMFYDLWTFQTGEDRDRRALDALYLERARRKLPHSTWAPGIFLAKLELYPK